MGAMVVILVLVLPDGIVGLIQKLLRSSQGRVSPRKP